jgi:hypothetical protein
MTRILQHTVNKAPVESWLVSKKKPLHENRGEGKADFSETATLSCTAPLHSVSPLHFFWRKLDALDETFEDHAGFLKCITLGTSIVG